MGFEDKNLGGGGMNLKINPGCEVRDSSVCAGIVESDAKVVAACRLEKSLCLTSEHDLK